MFSIPPVIGNGKKSASCEHATCGPLPLLVALLEVFPGEACARLLLSGRIVDGVAPVAMGLPLLGAPLSTAPRFTDPGIVNGVGIPRVCCRLAIFWGLRKEYDCFLLDLRRVDAKQRVLLNEG